MTHAERIQAERDRINAAAGERRELARAILGVDWYDTESQARMVITWIVENQTEKGKSVMGYGTDGLTFRALRGANLARMPQFKNSRGEFAHTEPDGSDWSPAQWLQAVVGELGEYANVRKKFERGDIDAAAFQRAAEKELADVVIYLDILAAQLGIDLGAATMAKFNEVSARVKSTVRLDADDWHYTERPL